MPFKSQFHKDVQNPQTTEDHPRELPVRLPIRPKVLINQGWISYSSSFWSFQYSILFFLKEVNISYPANLEERDYKKPGTTKVLKIIQNKSRVLTKWIKMIDNGTGRKHASSPALESRVDVTGERSGHSFFRGMQVVLCGYHFPIHLDTTLSLTLNWQVQQGEEMTRATGT